MSGESWHIIIRKQGFILNFKSHSHAEEVEMLKKKKKKSKIHGSNSKEAVQYFSSALKALWAAIF